MLSPLRITTEQGLIMEEGVDELCECLVVTELEKEELVLDLNLVEEVVSRGGHCLLARLLSTKNYNKEAFKATKRKSWRITKPIRFHDMGEGLTRSNK